MGKNQEGIEVTDQETGEIFTLKPGSLVADIRDTLLAKRRMQSQAAPWSKMSEADQKSEIQDITSLSVDLVAAIVDLVAAGGHEVIHAKLDNFKIKDGAVTLTAKGAADDGALLALNHVGHKNLKIIVADAEQFDQKRNAVAAEPDQPSMFPDEAEPEEMSDQDIGEAAEEMDSDLEQMDDGDDLHADQDPEPEPEPEAEDEPELSE